MMKRIVSLLLALAPAWVALAETKTVTFDLPGWHCSSCAASTRSALKKLDGVEDVQTNLAKKEATVAYDDAKVGPEKMMQAIERVGYKATVKAAPAGSVEPSASDRIDSVRSPESVSFFEVPLECGAQEGLGCGSASKPLLKALDRDPKVKDAKINYSGTVLAVAWKDPAQAPAGFAVVDAALKERDLETAYLRGPAREKALKEYESERWYRAADVDRLSEREAQVIAARLVNRAKPRLHLPPDKLAALNKDLTAGIAATLTADEGEHCARDPLEEVTEVARKHLNEQQLAELRKAAAQGAGALPNETE